MQPIHGIAHFNGTSSLLFIISAFQAFYHSQIITWKIANIVLIVTSYLYNATYNDALLLLDYFTIYIIALSYLNNIYTTILLSSLLFFEYCYTKNIDTVKNVTFGMALVLALHNSYYYLHDIYYISLLFSSIIGVSVFLLRKHLHYNDNLAFHHNILLTWIWHICITVILYVSSITAK